MGHSCLHAPSNFQLIERKGFAFVTINLKVRWVSSTISTSPYYVGYKRDLDPFFSHSVGPFILLWSIHYS